MTVYDERSQPGSEEQTQEPWVQFEDVEAAGGYTVFPKCVQFDRDLSCESRFLYSLLRGYAYQDSMCFPGQQRVCDDMGKSDDTVRKYLAELAKARLLHIKRRGLNRTNLYTFLSLTRRYSVSGTLESREQDVGDVGTTNKQGTKKEGNNPPGAAGAAPDPLQIEKGMLKKDAVAQLVDLLQPKSSPLAESQKGRFAREVGKYLESAKSDEELNDRMAVVDEAITRMADRWDDYQLSFGQAVNDLQNGRVVGNQPASGGKSTTPEEAIEEFEEQAANELRRYIPLLSRHDFTSEEQPKWPVYSELGGDDGERYRNWQRIKSVVRRRS